MHRDVAPLPGYPEPYGLLCAMLQDATLDWRSEIESDLGPEIVTWRARPGGASIGAIMLHMIAVEIIWIEGFVLDRKIDPEVKRELLWDEIDVDEERWPDVPAQPLSWYFALHDRYRVRTLEAIKEWPPAETVKAGPWREVTMRWVLNHVIQHETYHGGQILLMHDLWRHRAAKA